MKVEIERKFLLISDAWKSMVIRSEMMKQGYLSNNPSCSIRVRISDSGCHLNIKSMTIGARRVEFEYAIPTDDAEHLFNELCTGPCIEKERHFVGHAGHTWEIDEFHGANEGLVVAEIELADESEAFEQPSWLGDEVTNDERYYSVCLASNPYSQWMEDHE